ncbi:hypothetical protein D9M68_346850 [compost metagenome]
MEENEDVVEVSDHLFRVGDEVGAEVAAVELHAFDDFEFGFGGLGFFNRDDAFVADLLHRFSNVEADLTLAVCRDRADLCDFFRSVDLLGLGLEILDDFGDGEVDTALQVHRVHAGSNGLGAFANDRLGKNGCSRGAVAGDVVGLRSNFADHLGAHVLELVFEFDFLGDRYAVLGDARSAEGLVDDDVTTLRAERDLYRVSEDVDATQHLFARGAAELDFFCSH